MSIRRFLRKLRLALRSTPRSARDLVASYDEYLSLQRETFRSFESEVLPWVDGQRRFLKQVLSDTSRSARLLDCACGDGAGLYVLREQGFTSVVGVEVGEEKAARACRSGFPVVVCDMHDLSFFPTDSFDVIICSHTLEHAFDPGLVLEQFHRLLSPRGLLHVVLPYPDCSHRNELAHVGKYELGTHRRDAGEAVRRFFTARAFRLLGSRLDEVREPEIWLRLEQVPVDTANAGEGE